MFFLSVVRDNRSCEVALVLKSLKHRPICCMLSDIVHPADVKYKHTLLSAGHVIPDESTCCGQVGGGYITPVAVMAARAAV